MCCEVKAALGMRGSNLAYSESVEQGSRGGKGFASYPVTVLRCEASIVQLRAGHLLRAELSLGHKFLQRRLSDSLQLQW